MHQHGRNDPDAEKLYDLIADVKIAMMTTVDADGTMHARPMYSQEADEHGDLWFFTKLASPKLAEISRDNEVNLAYSHPSKQHYVSVSGRASVVQDAQKAEELWSEGLRTWFPKGSDDPRIALIKVDVDMAEYWDSPSSTMVYAYGYLKAITTGERPNPGENASVRF